MRLNHGKKKCHKLASCSLILSHKENHIFGSKIDFFRYILRCEFDERFLNNCREHIKMTFGFNRLLFFEPNGVQFLKRFSPNSEEFPVACATGLPLGLLNFRDPIKKLTRPEGLEVFAAVFQSTLRPFFWF